MKVALKAIEILIISIQIFAVSCNKSNGNRHSIRLFSKVYPPDNYQIAGAIIDGKKEGLWVTCDSVGKIEQEETFVNGQSFGETKYYTNGNLAATSIDTLIKNDTISNYKQFNPYGKILVIGQYINGKQMGIWTYYHNNGRDIKKKVSFEEKKVRVIYEDTDKVKAAKDNY